MEKRTFIDRWHAVAVNAGDLCTKDQPSFTDIPKICVLPAGYRSEAF